MEGPMETYVRGWCGQPLRIRESLSYGGAYGGAGAGEGLVLMRSWAKAWCVKA
jgi:hypothetical protein